MLVQQPEINTKPLFGKDFIRKLIGFEEWVLKNRREFEKKYANTNNQRIKKVS